MLAKHASIVLILLKLGMTTLTEFIL